MRAAMLRIPFLAMLTAVLAAAVCFAAPVEPSAQYPLGVELARSWTSPEQRQRLLEQLNALRAAHGLGMLRAQPALQETAQAHADFLSLHQQVGHGQRRGMEGFSGERPLQRARAAGYPVDAGHRVVELFVIGHSDGEGALAHLLSGPYHRHHLLWAAAQEVGIGLSVQPGLVLSLGAPSDATPGATPPAQWLLWPAPDARQVPAMACCERPRPMGLEEFGTPVSVQGPAGQRLQVQRFELLDAQGERVVTHLLQADSDAALAQSPHVAYLLPPQPLRGGLRYTVEVDAKSGGERLTRRWHFETAP
jgi:uncharacterized protein YkwD